MLEFLYMKKLTYFLQILMLSHAIMFTGKGMPKHIGFPKKDETWILAHGNFWKREMQRYMNSFIDVSMIHSRARAAHNLPYTLFFDTIDITLQHLFWLRIRLISKEISSSTRGKESFCVHIKWKFPDGSGIGSLQAIKDLFRTQYSFLQCCYIVGDRPSSVSFLM